MARPTSRQVATKTARVKTAVSISPKAFKCLGAACLAEDMTQSELVEQLISRHLSGYFVANRGTKFNQATQVISEDSAGPVTELGESAAA